MRHIALPDTGTADAWRKAARACLREGLSPADVSWGTAQTERSLFDDQPIAGAAPVKMTVPRSFVSLAETVCWHSDADRFARLYAFLWRLKDTPHLIADRGDRELAHLRAMEKSVHRCQHKMKAFVRFREIGDRDDLRRSFAAWFEPTHHTVEPTADFFARRFADMDWRIVTPEKSAIFQDGSLSFAPGQPKPALPEDAGEALWLTYFRSIFNPARLKVQAMTSEMPKKYWKNLPEAATIPDLIANAPARARAMAQAAPTLPPVRAGKARQQLAAHMSAWDGPKEALPAAIYACTRCPLHRTATQAVPGVGPLDAALMIVGEQPGDQEDLTGLPFVGPAGQLFDKVAQSAGLNRAEAFVTNAVKHFKFTPRGKRRLHQRPNSGEIEHCRWWLDAERSLVQPKLILALGATAAEALTGSGSNILRRRGTVEQLADGTPVLLSVHPSFLLRLPDPAERQKQMALFEADLRRAVEMVVALTARSGRQDMAAG
ncbi:UdgX family uracil-DNA binding protein [Hoeflea ulvae]|uniref:Type-4 uracil-DNA glycosylase n=1 Tax=Hoeflea ulvae TaxID=2983764 RepID=A0ABT3YAL1_9HYPH|nr:UdgX family uracil-DNA binding protein [Hoeflea ulvae]MCY0092915.1 UdgX family uracil-DNA binding protein [Hoeflea ulvae]